MLARPETGLFYSEPDGDLTGGGYFSGMVVVAFVAPYLLDATTRFVKAAARLPDTELALVTCEPEHNLPSELRRSLAAHWRIDDALDAGQITTAVQAIGERIGRVQRLLAVLEQLQVPVAQAREHLSIAGMDVATARNFRDKAQMKSVLRAAGVPCARHRLADSAAAAAGFAKEVGFPLVVKPPAGSGAKSTFRLDDADDLRVWLNAAPPSPGRLALLEEFLSGDEGSYDSVMVDGKIIWDSVSSYLPTPLEVLRNPWIQWMVLLPRAIDGPEYADIRAIAPTALSALGLHSGLTHLEWFRRPDGTVAVSEVAVRPPGAQITSMLCYAHDFDLYGAWARLMVHGTFAPPERGWSAGTVFLRGQGTGHVRAVHGLDGLPPGISSVVVESHLPEPGQVSSGSYEGDGYIIVRHRDTAVVTDAMRRLVTGVQVELG
jgi:phosphoribosylaminoimidazole carboxylase (NCAIR synthetase)